MVTTGHIAASYKPIHRIRQVAHPCLIGLLGPRESCPPNAISIGSAVLQDSWSRRTHLTDREHGTLIHAYCVGMGRIYAVHAMRPDNCSFQTASSTGKPRAYNKVSL